MKILDIYAHLKNKDGKIVQENRFSQNVEVSKFYADASLSMNDHTHYKSKAVAKEPTVLMCLNKENYKIIFGNDNFNFIFI